MPDPLKILALEAYYGGSHQAFLETWIAHSRHDWTVLGLPPYKWKWRMRHAAITFAEQLSELESNDFDLLFCSDMMNLAELRGLAPMWAGLPCVLYFHENQLTYPTQRQDPRDHHYAFTNLISALAADAVWFNSQHHRDGLLDALTAFLRKMPDFQELDSIERVRSKSSIWPPGVQIARRTGHRRPGPLRICWASRWEADKNPADFFHALYELQNRGVDFRLYVLGESFKNVPPVFDEARQRLVDHVDQWGYCESRCEYERSLQSADVIVSTAIHEFFGIAVVEGVTAGAIPVLPPRLSYPEIFAPLDEQLRTVCFYDGTVTDLADRLYELSQRIQEPDWVLAAQDQLATAVAPFQMAALAPRMDAELNARVR